MSTSVSGASKYFPKAQEGFTTTTSGSVSSGGTSVGLSSTGNYTNGDTVVLIIEPGVSGKEQSFTGVIDTSGVQVTGVVWTSGTNSAHSGGVTVVDYISAAHIDLISTGILLEHNPAGTHGAVTATSVSTDTITEKTAATGVTIDGVKLKDNKVATDSAVDSTSVSAGMVVQVAYNTYTAVDTTTTVIPDDDTIPQNTEGKQFMTVSITPKSATNILVIDCIAMVAKGGLDYAIGALFQDSTANALAADGTIIPAANNKSILTVRHIMVAGTTSSTTFNFRAGPAVAGTLTFNGAVAARLYGATVKSSMVIWEYKA